MILTKLIMHVLHFFVYLKYLFQNFFTNPTTLVQNFTLSSPPKRPKFSQICERLDNSDFYFSKFFIIFYQKSNWRVVLLNDIVFKLKKIQDIVQSKSKA